MPANETLLRLLSLEFLGKVAKRLDVHWTTVLLLAFFDKDQASLNITRLHSTHNKVAKQLDFCLILRRVKNQVKKSSRLARA